MVEKDVRHPALWDIAVLMDKGNIPIPVLLPILDDIFLWAWRCPDGRRNLFPGDEAKALQAKGYPDLITRSFLNLVHMTNPQLPILGLMDFDPDGVNILKCYRYGSQKLAHEINARTPEIRWLGIKSSQLMHIHGAENVNLSPDQASSQDSQSSAFTLATTRTAVSSTSCQDPIMYLSSRDRRAAVSALRVLQSSPPGEMEVTEMVRELQVMLNLGIKAEIEWLDESGNLCQWLDQEIFLALS